MLDPMPSDCFVHFTTINDELKQNTTDSNI